MSTLPVSNLFEGLTQTGIEQLSTSQVQGESGFQNTLQQAINGLGNLTTDKAGPDNEMNQLLQFIKLMFGMDVGENPGIEQNALTEDGDLELISENNQQEQPLGNKERAFEGFISDLALLAGIIEKIIAKYDNYTSSLASNEVTTTGQDALLAQTGEPSTSTALFQEQSLNETVQTLPTETENQNNIPSSPSTQTPLSSTQTSSPEDDYYQTYMVDSEGNQYQVDESWINYKDKYFIRTDIIDRWRAEKGLGQADTNSIQTNLETDGADPTEISTQNSLEQQGNVTKASSTLESQAKSIFSLFDMDVEQFSISSVTSGTQILGSRISFEASAGNGDTIFGQFTRLSTRLKPSDSETTTDDLGLFSKVLAESGKEAKAETSTFFQAVSDDTVILNFNKDQDGNNIVSSANKDNLFTTQINTSLNGTDTSKLSNDPSLTQSSSEASQAIRIDQGKILSQLDTGIAQVIKLDKQNAVLHLNPPELGSVKINLSIDHQNQIHANFIAEHPETKQIIEANMNHLKDQLAQNGFSLAQVNIDLGGNFSGYQSHYNRWEVSPNEENIERNINTQVTDKDNENIATSSNRGPNAGRNIYVVI